MLEDRSDDPEEPLRVYADPAAHPFAKAQSQLRSLFVKSAPPP
jgi:hypothetical protein